MILLMAFAFVAGAGTAITPCVLPVLPAILSASALGGRRRRVQPSADELYVAGHNAGVGCGAHRGDPQRG